jgi:ribonuclease PH
VLEIEYATFSEGRRYARRNGFHDRRRYEDAARIREAFQSRCNDERLAERKIILKQDITEMDADSHVNRLKL